MVGFIALCVGVVLAGFAFKKVSDYVEARVKGVTHSEAAVEKAAKVACATGTRTASAVASGYNSLPRLAAAFASTACAFMVLAVVVGVACPPQGEFTTQNVDWATRDAGVLGSTADAVLVRTWGASVEPGFMYSTATLSGQQYVSVIGSPWVATDHPATLAGMAYVVLALMGGVIGLIASGALERIPARKQPATPAAA
jgi:hypothetical protein